MLSLALTGGPEELNDGGGQEQADVWKQNTRDKEISDQVVTPSVAMSFIASLVAISDWSKMDREELSLGKACNQDTKSLANATVGRNSNKCHLPENQVPTPIYEVRDSRFSEQISLVMMGM